MTRIEATYLYRREIKAAIENYNKRIRVIWAAWGNPIPLSQECASAMIDAWGNLRVAWSRADQKLTQTLES